MFAVIFKAQMSAQLLENEKEFDVYSEMAVKLRDLAFKQYGCLEFISSCEDGYEIAISYWETQEQIKVWKEDADHLKAQSKGAAAWYDHYTVEVVEVVRKYSK